MAWFGPSGGCGCCTNSLCSLRFILEMSGWPAPGDYTLYRYKDPPDLSGDGCENQLEVDPVQAGIDELNGTYILDLGNLLPDETGDNCDSNPDCTCSGGRLIRVPLTYAVGGAEEPNAVYVSMSLTANFNSVYPRGTPGPGQALGIHSTIDADVTPPTVTFFDWSGIFVPGVGTFNPHQELNDAGDFIEVTETFLWGLDGTHITAGQCIFGSHEVPITIRMSLEA